MQTIVILNKIVNNKSPNKTKCLFITITVLYILFIPSFLQSKAQVPVNSQNVPAFFRRRKYCQRVL